MSMSLRGPGVTVAHSRSGKDGQIYQAANAIWGLKPEKLPKAKFDELDSVLERCLTRKYGPYIVKGMPLSSGNVFVISMDPVVLEPSYEKIPCFLDTCMATAAAFKCGRCGDATYCSKKHQELDWPSHKVECISRE